MKGSIVADLGGLDEFKFLRKIAVIFEAVYTNSHLPDREMDFFIATLIGLKRGYKNPNSKDFAEIYNTYYLNDGVVRTQKQKRSLLATVRKNLIEKDILSYDKNTQEISVQGDWYKLESLSITINVSKESK